VTTNELLRSRIVGAAITGIGLVITFLVVPNQTEDVSRAVIQPATLPMIYGIGIALCGLTIVARPTPDSGERALFPFLRILFFTVATCFVMEYLGYLVLAPALVLSLMLYMGERRPVWLLIGVLAIPLAGWVGFGMLLGRQLP